MHTNRGTCQVCGRIQAIDNGSKITAKHGYLVAGFGYFNGVCPGARYKPAELDLTVTHSIIAQLEQAATEHEAEAKGYAAYECKYTDDDRLVGIAWGEGVIICRTYTVWDATMKVTKRSRHGTYQTTGGYRDVAITVETPLHIIDDTQHKAAAVAEQNARHARSHVAMMRSAIVPRLGQALYPAAEVIKADKKAAKAKAVEGVRFPTKAARKDALDKLNRQYSKLRERISDAYLAGDRGERGQTLYYAAHELHQWRPHHSAAARELYPQLSEVVDQIEALVKEREVVKTAL